MIQATFEKRGVVEGHGAGLRDLGSINAFAAAGLASDHEGWLAEEVWDKLRHGIFMEIRPHSMPEIIAGLLQRGLADWSQIAFATDDRSASDTLRMGATDYNVRLAIQSGLSPEIAIQCVTINPARHMRLTPWVGSVAPGRFADIVLLDDVERVSIGEVWADGRQVSSGTDYLGPLPPFAGLNGRRRPSISAARSPLRISPSRQNPAVGRCTPRCFVRSIGMTTFIDHGTSR